MIHCFVTIAGPYTLLPYFLKYYSRIGVERFVYNVYGPDLERYERIEQVFEDCGVSYERGFWEREKRPTGRNRIVRICKLVNRRKRKFLSDWTFYPDLDEFAEFPGDNIREYVDSLPGPVRIVQGEWWDRVAGDGSLAEIVPGRPLEEQFPVTAKLACLFSPVTHVIVACKGSASPEHHPKIGRQAARRAFSDLIPVHHFKWNSGIKERLQERYKYYPAMKAPTASIARVVKYLEKHEKLPVEDGQIRLRDSGHKLGI